MVRVGKIKFVEIYAGNNDVYVVYNTKKPFDKGHTHIKSYATAEYLAKLIAYGRFPSNCKNAYLLESYIRLETNKEHINQAYNVLSHVKKPYKEGGQNDKKKKRGR